METYVRNTSAENFVRKTSKEEGMERDSWGEYVYGNNFLEIRG